MKVLNTVHKLTNSALRESVEKASCNSFFEELRESNEYVKPARPMTSNVALASHENISRRREDALAASNSSEGGEDTLW